MVAKAPIKSAILAVLTDQASRITDPVAAREALADGLATAIYDAITSAEAVGNVLVIGSATTQTGAVRLPIK